MSKLLLIEEALREELLEGERTRRRLRNEPLRSLSDSEIIKDYRVNRSLFEKLVQIIVPRLQPQKNSRGIDPVRKIFTALNFFARGSYQGSVGKDEITPMAQPTVSKCLNEVINVLNDPEIVRRYLRFPQTREERNKIKIGFYEMYGFPGVCGCIDGTHVAIIRPNENEERFLNRKNYHSLNVLMICDSNNKILHVDSRYGGATHDSFVWQNSPLLPHFEALVESGEQAFLLGDSGYALRPYMMTPIDEAREDTPEGVYNITQKKTRSVIERTFGILKGRWRCLLAARELHYHPEKAGRIIISCAVLHNMCIEEGLGEAEPLTNSEWLEEEGLQAAPARPVATNAEGLLRGRQVRQHIINILNRN